MAEFAPAVAIGLLLAPLLDRLPPRRALVAGNLVAAATWLALAAVVWPPAVIALVLLSGIATGVVRPLAMASVPRFVPDEQLEEANGALSVADNGATLVGAAASGALVTLVGAGPVLIGNAASFVVAALLLASCRELSADADEAAQAETPFVTRLRQGVAAVSASPELRTVAVAWTLVALGIGMTNGLLVPLLQGPLEGGAAAVGLVTAVMSAGLIAGNVVGGRSGRRIAPYYPLLLAVMGFGWMLAADARGVAVATIALLVCAVANGVAIVLNRSQVQRAAEPHQRAGIIALLMGGTSLAIAAGAVAGGALAELWGVREAFLVGGALALVVGAPAAMALAAAPRPARAPDAA